MNDQEKCENMDADDAMIVDRAILDALALLKEQKYARCGNCQFRDFGENEGDSCKLHRRNTSPDEYCLWFVERAGEVG